MVHPTSTRRTHSGALRPAFTTPPSVLHLRSTRESALSPRKISPRPNHRAVARPVCLSLPTRDDDQVVTSPSETAAPPTTAAALSEAEHTVDVGATASRLDSILNMVRVTSLSAVAAITAFTVAPAATRLPGRIFSNTSSPAPHDQPLQRQHHRLDASHPPFITATHAAAKYSKKTLSEKLSQVPVFAVTNASGQPYLAKMDGSGSQIGLIFFSHLDALNMLKDMQKNPGATDARVYIMGLDKAYEMVKAKPTPSGIRGSSGEELTMVFRFYPDSRQVKSAEGLVRKLRIRQGVDGVPVFVAKGLTLRKGGENVVPLFLTKEDLDAAWTKLRGTNKDLPASAQVVVGNLLFIIQQMENGDVPELRNLGFFAPRASVEYVAKEQSGPTGQARMHQNPVAAAQK